MKLIYRFLLIFTRAAVIKDNASLEEKKLYLAILHNELYYNNQTAESKWMCPICNTIHKPVSITGIGLEFQNCCRFGYGHRDGKSFATNTIHFGFSLKPWFYGDKK